MINSFRCRLYQFYINVLVDNQEKSNFLNIKILKSTNIYLDGLYLLKYKNLYRDRSELSE